ncbi:hypothetical protein RQP54_15985 [Curvibacter sp. APW13]|uniref:3'-5' exonuclease n=1 Tax=Curvibacter sp. APW13 TaxID=3077236 RepID=UPI0028DF43D8|nr:hypothetical protein [Curvibacter sp. APW13]MDT8992373.1 hypothetical protein [Curvibacter sp. APW13]
MTSAPAVLDIEASGLGRKSYPIEVGLALPDGQAFCTLVRPESDWTHWDPQAEQVHGIQRELLHTHGRPALEVAKALNERLAGMTVYSDGWANDYSWIGLLFDAAELQPRFKLENLRRLLSEDEAGRWHSVKDQVCAECAITRHRASADARLLQLTVLRLRSH